MDSDGTQDTRGMQANPVPRPAGLPGVPQPPAVPPRPAHAPAPAARPAIADWLNERRPRTRPGIWRLGHRLPDAGGEKPRLSAVTVVGMLIPAALGLVVWAVFERGGIPYQWAPLRLVTPDDWWETATVINAKDQRGISAFFVYRRAVLVLLVLAMARLGSWGRAARFFFERHPQPRRALLALAGALLVLALVFPDAFPGAFWDAIPVVETISYLNLAITGDYVWFTSALFVYSLYAVITLIVVAPFARVGGWRAYARERAAARKGRPAAPAADADAAQPARWPALREAGQHQAADVLTAEVATGRMTEVDCARLIHAWTEARGHGGMGAFTGAVLRDGAAAFVHPSGMRDLPGRAARHDPLTGQVRIGRFKAGERTPAAYGEAGAALDPACLGTSLLVVGPSGSGKTRNVIAPVVESLALRALTGRCAVVAVGAAGALLGPDSAFDVVIRLGDLSSTHDLDPYAGSDDPDEAAALLGEALAGADADGARRASTALAQVLGPYRAAHGTFPTLPVLRELLSGDLTALTDLRAALGEERHAAMRRELDARTRQLSVAGDPGPVLADRLAVLDRPVFADFFGSAGGAARPFSLRAVAHHPLRVRIDLPARGHEEASRLLTRLVLAQFASVAREAGRTHFVSLVLDDATAAVTAESVRWIQGMRSQNAGVVLALRTVADVPEHLHGPLYAAVGCRMALSGITTWDGSRFAEAWGTEWVETQDVSRHVVWADQPMTRALHALRKAVTGKAVTTESVTVRQVERARWSASELAHSVPPGHAVLSLTTVEGEHAPPLLVDLRG